MPFYMDPAGVLRARELEQWPWLAHGFSTRAAGDLGRETGSGAQQRFLKAAGASGMALRTLRQIHSSIVLVAEETTEGQAGDSLVARRAGLLVGIRTADCLPVLLVDVRRRGVAAAHAGWRGAARRVVQKTAGEMRALGSRPGDLHAAIGPGIRACCFEVGPEVLEEFFSQFSDAGQFCVPEPPNPAWTRLPLQVMTHPERMRPLDRERGRVDLAAATRAQLIAAGVPPGQIYDSGLCTACDPCRFHSYRRDRQAAGRMLAVIGARVRA